MSFAADFGGLTYVAPTFRSSGTNFAGLKAAGLNGLLENLIAAQTAITAPASAPTGSATGTDGSLPAGTYKAVFTYTNGYGETTASPESSGIVVSSTNHIAFTLPSLPTGANGINLYLTKAGGAAGSETLYTTGITTTTYNATKATWAGNAVPPAINTTAIQGRPLHKLRTPEQRRMQDIWDLVSAQLSAYLAGQPVAFDDVRKTLLEAESVFKGWAQVMAEINTLLHANPGQLTNGKRVFS